MRETINSSSILNTAQFWVKHCTILGETTRNTAQFWVKHCTILGETLHNFGWTVAQFWVKHTSLSPYSRAITQAYIICIISNLVLSCNLVLSAISLRMRETINSSSILNTAQFWVK
ncbi:MAG: hypothetical protein AB7E13_07280, partial [Arcobacteraceae bacterium]